MGKSLDAQRRGMAALAVLALVICAFACKPAPPVDVKADSVARGDRFAAAKQYGEAAAAYRTAAQADPQDGHVHMKLAEALWLAGKTPQAALEAQSAADLLPGDYNAQIRATTLALADGNFAAARARLAPLLKEHPDDVNLLVLSGNATAGLRDSGAALFNLADAVRTPATFKGTLAQFRQDSPDDDRQAEGAFRKALTLAPASSEASMALANFLWATGRLAESEGFLRRAADAMPGHAAVNHALGAYYMSLHRDDEAERYLKRAAAQGVYGRGARLALVDLYEASHRDEDALAVYESMGPEEDVEGAVSLPAVGIEIRLGRTDAAMRRLDALLAREPRNAKATRTKAQLLAEQHETAAAVKFARAAVAIAPDSADAQTVLGGVLEATGDMKGAFDAYTQALQLDPGSDHPPLADLTRMSLALGRDQDATSFARQAIRKGFDDRTVRLMLVQALIRSKDYSAAEQELQPVLARDPKAPDALVQLGALQAATGRREAARASFERALASDAGNLDALSPLVSFDLEDKRVAVARRRVDAALAAHPKSADHLVIAAQVYAAAAETGRAEATLRQAVAIDPLNERAAVALADLLDRQQRRAEAIELLTAFVGRRSDSVDGRIRLADLLDRAGRARDAESQYEAVLAQNRRMPLAAFRLAGHYVERGGQLDKALELALVAREQTPQNPAISELLGLIYLRKSLPNFAVRYLQEAVRGDPNNPTYRYRLGNAQLRSGHLPEARSELSRALQISQDFPEAQQARADLASARSGRVP